MTTTTKQRVVSVRGVALRGGYPYWAPAIYELVARKRDGVETYRPVKDGRERASHRAAERDAIAMAEREGIPYCPGVRLGSTVEQAVTMEEAAAAKAEEEARRAEEEAAAAERAIAPIRAALGDRYGRCFAVTVRHPLGISSPNIPPAIYLHERLHDCGGLGSFIFEFRSPEEVIAELPSMLQRHDEVYHPSASA